MGLAHFEANFIGDIKFHPIKYGLGPFKQTPQVCQNWRASRHYLHQQKLSRQIQFCYLSVSWFFLLWICQILCRWICFKIRAMFWAYTHVVDSKFCALKTRTPLFLKSAPNFFLLFLSFTDRSTSFPQWDFYLYIIIKDSRFPRATKKLSRTQVSST